MKVRDLLNLDCSYFDNTYSKPNGVVKVRALFDHSLTQGKKLDKLLVDHIRKHGKDEAYDKLKTKQIALTPSGIFEERRTYATLVESNPLLIIDIDNVDKPDLQQYKQYPWVVGAGESVSRKGVFILIYIEHAHLFKEHFHSLRTNYFPQADDLKDTTRLRYVSFGKAWLRNDGATIEPYKELLALPTEDIYEVTQSPPTTEHDNEETLRAIYLSLGSIEESGGLHPWTVRIAAKCNRRGITCDYAAVEIWEEISTLPIIQATARYTFERFHHDFKSIYSLYREQHNTTSTVRITRSRVLRFNEKIFERSPAVLQELVALVEQPEEKEVVYFSAIMLLGTLFPNRSFTYFNNKYYPNLYGYILGDAASFKGKAKLLRQALAPYQRRIDEEFKVRNDKKQQDIAYNKSIAKTQEERRVIDKIPDLNFFFDGNTSSAAMLKAMQDSPELVLFETEGDTITKTWRTDWGNYSDILRKAFEHEALYSLKKNANDENLLRIRIDKPRLSVLVSSTENQMRKVLNSDETENGLMSRFMFYVVQNDKKWHDGFRSNFQHDIGEILTRRLSPDIWFRDLYSEDLRVVMSQEALQLHQDYFNDVNDQWPDELFSIIALVRRAGTTTIRLAVLFEELKFEHTRGIVAVRQVSGESMQLAVDVMKILMQHLFVAWQTTYKASDFKETNVQDVTVRDKVRDLIEKSGGIRGITTGKIGVSQVAKNLGISKQLAKHYLNEAVEETVENAPNLQKGGYQGKKSDTQFYQGDTPWLALLRADPNIGYKRAAQLMKTSVATAQRHISAIRQRIDEEKNNT